jgi:hypothetical protein
MSLHNRIKRLEAAAAGQRALDPEIIANERGWVHLHLFHAFENRDRGEPLDEYEERILEAYEYAEATPGWRPKAIMPGFFGSPDLDPGKLEAALAAHVDINGLPDKLYTWTDAILDYYASKAEEQDHVV